MLFFVLPQDTVGISRDRDGSRLCHQIMTWIQNRLITGREQSVTCFALGQRKKKSIAKIKQQEYMVGLGNDLLGARGARIRESCG